MAITQINTVANLEVLTANSDDIVAKVIVRISSSDDSNPSKYKSEAEQSYKLKIDGVTPSTSGFVSYNDLTEVTVLGWVSSGISTCDAAIRNRNNIVRLMRLDTPVNVDKALPWKN